MTRTKPAEQRRAELLAAGQALFLAKGIAATSLDDVTQRAGVSKGLFYLYFASKEDLVLALQEQFSREVAARMAAAADIQADWAVRLDACVKTGFDCYRELHDLHEVLFHHGHPGPARSRARASHPGHRRTARGRHRRRRAGRVRPRIHRGALLREHARHRPGVPRPRRPGRRQAHPGRAAAGAPRGRPALARRAGAGEKARGACNHGGQDGRSLPFCFRTRDNRATDGNDCGSPVLRPEGVRGACTTRWGPGGRGWENGGDEAADG